MNPARSGIQKAGQSTESRGDYFGKKRLAMTRWLRGLLLVSAASRNDFGFCFLHFQRYNKDNVNFFQEDFMVTSIVLISVDRTRINETAQILSEMPGISEVYSVSGKYDLIAIARVNSNEELSELVTKSLLKVDGILKSETMLAFKTYSKHDLESLFSIGN